MDKVRSDIEARGGMSDDQIDQALAMTGKFMNGPVMLVTVFFTVVLSGLVISLIVSAVLKNAKPDFE